MSEVVDGQEYRRPASLVGRDEIAVRVARLGAEITAAYRGRTVTALIVCNGGMIFAADLIRAVDLSLEFDSIMVASYAGTCSTGTLTLRSELKMSLAGREVLVIDDILDTGRTLTGLRELLLEKQPASLKFCVMCDKRERREVPFEADYVGMVIPDRFVVGYGMDYNGLYRNLPYLGVMD